MSEVPLYANRKLSLPILGRRCGKRPGIERLVFHCRTTSASTAPCTSRRMCCPTHCASYCAPCQPLLRAFSGWIRSPPPDRFSAGVRGARVGENCPFGSLRSPQRALPTETKVESGTSQSKSGTSLNFSNSGFSAGGAASVRGVLAHPPGTPHTEQIWHV